MRRFVVVSVYWPPREDSNLDLSLRRALFYPVELRGGCAAGFYRLKNDKSIDVTVCYAFPRVF